MSYNASRRVSKLVDVGRAALVMTVTTYADTFWGGDLSSAVGYDALVRRNHDGKKICSELEEYLKKRSKLESEYSKSLTNLAKTFKERDQIGVLEATLNRLRSELDVMAAAHSRAADVLSHQADTLEKFRKEQTTNRKGIEDALAKSQTSKFTQLSKTKQLEKNYVRRCLEKDSTEKTLRELYTTTGAPPKEVEKARLKATKAEEEADKADNAYKSAVLVLEDNRVNWETDMIAACNDIQQLDEERITFLRQELWKAVNVDSKISLDVDNSCEQVREILEKCDVISDIDAFTQLRGTGTEHPEPFVYRHYTKIVPTDNDNCSETTDGAYSTYASLGDMAENSSASPSPSPSPAMGKARKNHFTFPKGMLTLKKST